MFRQAAHQFRRAAYTTTAYARPACAGIYTYPTRTFGTTAATYASHGTASSKLATPTEKKEEVVVGLVNKDIPFKFVTPVDPETGKLGNVTPLAQVLSSIDPKKSFIQLVALDPPVVKTLNKAEAFAKKKQAQAKQRVVLKKNTTKEIQVTWGVGEADLDHKLAKVRSELEEGIKVDIVFARKAKSKPPTIEEMQEKAQDVVDSLQDASTEWRPWEILKGVLVIHLKPKEDFTASTISVGESRDERTAKRRERDRLRTLAHNKVTLEKKKEGRAITQSSATAGVVRQASRS